MTFTMYDAIDVAALPDGADAYAGYVGGKWPTWAALKEKFPKAHLVSIAIAPGEHALACDREPGDLTAAQVVAFVKAEHGRDVKRPIVYASAANMPPILAELNKAGIALADVRLWSAHYGAGKHICGPASCKQMTVAADGTQWTDAAAGVGGVAIDESVLAADFFGVAPAPAPAELDGTVVWYAGTALHNRGVISKDSGKTWT